MMDEYTKQLAAQLPDEMDGVKKYTMLSQMAETAGHSCDAAVLRDMAWEEYTHAKHIKRMIHEKAAGDPPANHAEMAKKWEETEQALDVLRSKK